MKTTIYFYFKDSGRPAPETIDFFVGRDAVVYEWTSEYKTGSHPEDVSRMIPRHDIHWRERNEI